MPPNIVIINPDQTRADYASGYGYPFIGTRHLDRLAAMGTRFDRAFVSCPMCAPSRTSFVTGTYPMEHGVRNYGGGVRRGTTQRLAAVAGSGLRARTLGKGSRRSQTLIR